MNPAARKIVPRPKALNCPQCGAAIELRAMGAAASVVCGYCASTLDATNPQLVILQRWKAKMTVQPFLPLGSRGKLAGAIWEVIGFQQRGIQVEGTDYYWREYVLFNPYKGFRYLSEYDNHWNFVTAIPSLPVAGTNARNRPTVTHDGIVYDHFQTARASTSFVIGEFPWQVKMGETVEAADYVSPPHMLSSETTKDEVTWSKGEYVPAQDIWTAFQIPGAPPPPVGVYSTQPAPPAAKSTRPWGLFFVFSLLLLGMMIFFATRALQETVLNETYTFNPAATGEKSFVTRPFVLRGAKANVHVAVHGDLDNAWAFISMALINEETGEAFDFGRQVSYYHGVDGGESWTEDSRDDAATLPSIPGGLYYLRLEPETEAPTGAAAALAQRPIRYNVQLVRDVPFYFRYFLGIFLLLLPLPFMGRKGANFEALRWHESDYGVPPNAIAWSSSSGDDDE
ncbi:MAG TPA: DUF4178 domain-containing protein [Bryobacteraceae bacterium]|nr:DUF4178 domain-containing protein [Bryobacteraceae bacterium]